MILAVCAVCGLSMRPCLAQTSPSPVKLRLIRGSTALDASLYNHNGDHIGNIHDLVFDENLGGMTHLIISAGAYPGMGDVLPPVPWQQITAEKLPNGQMRYLAEGHWPAANAKEIPGSAGIKLVKLTDVKGARLLDQQSHTIGENRRRGDRREQRCRRLRGGSPGPGFREKG